MCASYKLGSLRSMEILGYILLAASRPQKQSFFLFVDRRCVFSVDMRPAGPSYGQLITTMESLAFRRPSPWMLFIIGPVARLILDIQH